MNVVRGGFNPLLRDLEAPHYVSKRLSHHIQNYICVGSIQNTEFTPLLMCPEDSCGPASGVNASAEVHVEESVH